MMRDKSNLCSGILGAVYVEGLDQSICPICYLVSTGEAKYAENLLYENVLDPDVRVRFLESLGLCTNHAWLLLETAERIHDRLGVSILYLDALKKLRDSLEEIIDSGGDPSYKCFMCKYSKDAEDRYTTLYRECLNPEDYRRSKAIFCLKHLRSIIRYWEESKKKQILEVHREKLKEVEENLDRYISKHSYENKEPITREEAEAVERAIVLLKGLKIYTVTAERKPGEEKEMIENKRVNSFASMFKKVLRPSSDKSSNDPCKN
ncbi:MAG: DUF6062 family protein [Sulfolobales archaeon]